MLCNFKKRFPHPPEQQPVLSPLDLQFDMSDTNSPEQINDPVTQSDLEERAYVPGHTCPFCARHSETDDIPISISSRPCLRGDDHRSLPSFRSVMEVLYPPSYPSTPSPFPPSYSCESRAQEGDPEISLSISPTSNTIHERPLSCSRCDPLAQEPSLTGVPSQGIPSRGILLAQPNISAVNLDGGAPEEPLPAYSRFDQRRPRFPAATDILGPYPPLSVLSRSAR